MHLDATSALNGLTPMLETTMPALRAHAHTLAERFVLLVGRFVYGHKDPLRELDARALADIGIHSSEIESIESEWRGTAGLTRRRIAGELRHV